MSVANSRMTIGSIFGAVQTSANTLTNTLNAANSAIGMVNTFVEKAALEQKRRAIVDGDTFLKRLREEKAMETTLARLQINSFCAQSKEHATIYQGAYDELEDLFSKLP